MHIHWLALVTNDGHGTIGCTLYNVEYAADV